MKNSGFVDFFAATSFGMMAISQLFSGVLELDMVKAPNRGRGPCRWSTLDDNSSIPTCDFILNSKLNSSERVSRSIKYAQRKLSAASASMLNQYGAYRVPGDDYDVQLSKIIDLYHFQYI